MRRSKLRSQTASLWGVCSPYLWFLETFSKIHFYVLIIQSLSWRIIKLSKWTCKCDTEGQGDPSHSIILVALSLVCTRLGKSQPSNGVITNSPVLLTVCPVIMGFSTRQMGQGRAAIKRHMPIHPPAQNSIWGIFNTTVGYVDGKNDGNDRLS